jgi:hypothetical protein
MPIIPYSSETIEGFIDNATIDRIEDLAEDERIEDEGVEF